MFMKYIIITITILFSINIQAQLPCEKSENAFLFRQKNEKTSLQILYNNEIYPNLDIEEIDIFPTMMRFFNKFKKDNSIQEIETKNIKIHFYDKTIDSKLVVYCSESFEKQISPFLLKEIDKVTLISNKGIPFLTFTRIE